MDLTWNRAIHTTFHSLFDANFRNLNTQNPSHLNLDDAQDLRVGASSTFKSHHTFPSRLIILASSNFRIQIPQLNDKNANRTRRSVI